MAYSSWSVSFNEQPSAAKWNILGTNDASFNDGTGIGDGAILPEHLLAGAGTSWAWQSWTPTLSGWTIGTGGSAQTVAYYQQIGRAVHFMINTTLGTSGASVGGGGITISLPVTAVVPPTTGTASHPVNAVCWYENTGTYNYQGGCVYGSSTTIIPKVWKTDGTYLSDAKDVLTSVPFAWGAGDSMNISGSYRAA